MKLRLILAVLLFIFSFTFARDGGVVKMSKSGICHEPGSTYYDRTKNYTAYPSLDACLKAGGRLPNR